MTMGGEMCHGRDGLVSQQRQEVVAAVIDEAGGAGDVVAGEQLPGSLSEYNILDIIPIFSAFLVLTTATPGATLN